MLTMNRGSSNPCQTYFQVSYFNVLSAAQDRFRIKESGYGGTNRRRRGIFA